MNAVELNISFEKVKPDVNSIIKCMGYKNHDNLDLVLNSTKTLLSESEQYAEIKGGYKLLTENKVNIESGKVTINEVTFVLDKIIAKQLTNSTYISLIAVTLGKKYDDWINEYFIKGDPFQGYIADIIGSELVENAADVVETIVENESSKLDLNCTNRYSPGYCGWDVSEQHKFFSFLPQNFCGIELSKSALMKPVKSVSAIIGLGKLCKKKDYQCSLCALEDCYKRNRQDIKKV